MDPELHKQVDDLQAEKVKVDKDYEVPHDVQFKTIIIGDTGVGKSCMVTRLI